MATAGRSAMLSDHELSARGITLHCDHDWEAPDRWGVVFGVSRCKRCRKIAMESDLPALRASGVEVEDDGKEGGND